MAVKDWSTRKFFTVVIILFSFLIGLATWTVTDTFTKLGIPDPPNLVTIVIEIGVGVFIAFIIFVYSARHQNRITRLVNEVKVFEDKQTQQMGKVESLTVELEKMIKKQDDLLNEVRKVYAMSYVNWVHTITVSFVHIIKLYENNYLQSKPFSKNKQTARNNLIDAYNRNLTIWSPKIEVMELVKYFGQKLANLVWTSQTHLQAEDWNPSTDKYMAGMMNDYIGQVKKAINLKKEFLPFCDESVKIKDESMKENYDKINNAKTYPEIESEHDFVFQETSEEDSENS